MESHKQSRILAPEAAWARWHTSLDVTTGNSSGRAGEGPRCRGGAEPHADRQSEKVTPATTPAALTLQRAGERNPATLLSTGGCRGRDRGDAHQRVTEEMESHKQSRILAPEAAWARWHTSLDVTTGNSSGRAGEGPSILQVPQMAAEGPSRTETDSLRRQRQRRRLQHLTLQRAGEEEGGNCRNVLVSCRAAFVEDGIGRRSL
ncbi:uncharacterized protein LOC116959959 [Tyto alba]|uniref:uncharacterized protein LOC116959959 n=1 Tax=Tyto alba TaxID=56313 RepID=UPI001C68289F|nr:uncharacterized protein LOC116959959 [Tyto alba]XP_042647538.1 uncharacterized protein LOC116959959 [Tyto alba]XP_042647539.1 uncharacterized protein LOC116959959 [Tyto alba]XP_042647540.1 uncharacterized protein LOC116959959 [Tyto alba]XP_042647541.1 uncharacterized protein LOC116959959 [Tyto alba]XP_042647542.1 uncharacterized protein LOC116959959 [Tyto alba]XP_042647543.1 uncharacterized protein LOC116959959 [Tyto alba]XP_042647544.1 uncharacterized protein LOC116959959 [Tyto alba]XP_